MLSWLRQGDWLARSGRRLSLLLDRDFRRGWLRGSVLSRAARRGEPICFRVRGHPMWMRAPSFLGQYPPIFVHEEYALDLDDPAPRILDLGANVGMATLYFKRRFPDARITAFEADPEIHRLLRRNVEANRLGSVEIHDAAAWTSDGEKAFLPDGLGGGRLVEADPDGALASVRTVDLARFLEGRQYDVVKMDVEGAERALIPHIRRHLAAVKYLVFEYHSEKARPQGLGALLELLESLGFRLYVKTEDRVARPFAQTLAGPFDNRLVIYGRRSQP